MRLSITIPVGPGENDWRRLLPDLARLDADAEILLVGVGGETPDDFSPSEFGLRAPTRWLETAAGRAGQLNAGARAARGRTLCFLHADSRLGDAALRALAGIDLDSDTIRYFDLRFHDGPPLMALNRLGARLRSRWLRLPFGDQGLCLSRALFARLGDFDERLACGEDHDLVWRARRLGVVIAPLRASLSTSARKYAERGWWRTTSQHLRLTAEQARKFSREARGA